MKVKRYSSTDADIWNTFIATCKNQTFLFNRAFMDYHADRFTDHSLMVYDEDEKLVAVVPANLNENNEFVSHQGLTYGAIIVGKDAKLLLYIQLVYHILKFLNDEGISTVFFKQIPAFFNEHPTDELEYIFFLLDAVLYRRDVAFVIDQQHYISYTGNIRREGNKAEKLNIMLKEDDDVKLFWEEILVPNLMGRYNVQPVHSLAEIELLKSRFPKNIQQYNVYVDDKIIAGTTMFVTPTVAHCQYISASNYGRKSGALNYLFKTLIDKTFKHIRYFDFGIVNEQQGRTINTGMLFWKESFGCRARKHDFYRLGTSDYFKLAKFI